jgi:hypothetical protein
VLTLAAAPLATDGAHAAPAPPEEVPA